MVGGNIKDQQFIQNSKARTIQQILRLYGQEARFTLLKDLLFKLQENKFDKGVATLTEIFLGAQYFDNQIDMKAALEFARDIWLKQTLGNLTDHDKESFCIDKIDSISESVALLNQLITTEGNAKLNDPVLRN